MAVRVQLPLWWNTYLLYSSDIMWETNEVEAENIALLIFVRCWCFNRRWVRNSYLRPTELASFSSQDFSQSNKHDTYWHVVPTENFYVVLFLWAVAVSDFFPLEIYKNLSLSLSTTTFTVNRHADNILHKYIHLFQILYSMKSVSKYCFYNF